MTELADVDVDVLAVGDNAIPVSDGDNEGWVAKSLIDEESNITGESEKGDSGNLVIPQWKAEELEFV